MTEAENRIFNKYAKVLKRNLNDIRSHTCRGKHNINEINFNIEKNIHYFKLDYDDNRRDYFQLAKKVCQLKDKYKDSCGIHAPTNQFFE